MATLNVNGKIRLSHIVVGEFNEVLVDLVQYNLTQQKCLNYKFI